MEFSIKKRQIKKIKLQTFKYFFRIWVSGTRDLCELKSITFFVFELLCGCDEGHKSKAYKKSLNIKKSIRKYTIYQSY